MPRFSVLLPTHNRADVLPFAIRSVLNQTERDFELLIVGDGCTDATANVVAGFSDDRIRWFDLPKAPGFGYANRNVALRQARGELIAFAAHDDILLPDHLARMAAVFADPEATWAYSLGLWVLPDGVVVPVSGNLTLPDEFQNFIDHENFIAAQSVVHRRECLDAAGYWPEEAARGGDWILWRRMLDGERRKGLRYLPVPTGLHFRANWRTQGLPRADRLGAFAARAAWWPKALKVDLSGGGPEQAQVDAAMRASPQQWSDAVREAVTAVLGRLAADRVATIDRDDVVAALRERIRTLSETPGGAPPKSSGTDAETKPLPGPHLLADGVIIRAEAGGSDHLIFRLPPDAADLRLISKTFKVPGDERRLGVLIGALALGDGTGWDDIALDDPGLADGFHAVEGSDARTWRWTSGEARLSPALWAKRSGSILLRVTGSFAAGAGA